MSITINHVTLSLGLSNGSISVGAGISTSKMAYSFNMAVSSFNSAWTKKYRNVSKTTMNLIREKAQGRYSKYRGRKYDIRGVR